MTRTPTTVALVVIALVVGAAGGWFAHATRPNPGEPAAVNALRRATPEAGRVPAQALGDLAADVNRIITTQPQGDATDAALMVRVQRTLPVGDVEARNLAVTLWWELCREAPAPFGGAILAT